MQWGTLTREVPLLRVLWVWTSHRQKHWDYSWDLAAAGTRYMGKVFSNRKTLWILWVRTAAVPQRSTWTDHLQNKISQVKMEPEEQGQAFSWKAPERAKDRCLKLCCRC